MAYIDSEETTPIGKANELETTNQPAIHLSATDGKMVSDSTQIVFHKNEDGSLFCELFPKESIKNTLGYYVFALDSAALSKLREFLNCPITY